MAGQADGPDRAGRGQVTLGTLTVFLAMVLVAAIAAGVLLNTAGYLEAKSERTAHQSGNQVTDRVEVLEVIGLQTAEDGESEVGGMILVVAKSPGAGDIDLTRMTIQWIDDTGTYDLAHESVVNSSGATVDGEFVHTVIKDEDGSLSGLTADLDDRDDRAAIVVDIGNDATGGKVARPYDTIEPRTVIRKRAGGLGEDNTASLRLTTADGTGTTVRVVVPESIDGRTAVRL